jgi:hypothetical protein
MGEAATRIAQFAGFLFSPIETVNMDLLSPFVPYSIFQAAAVQSRLWKLTKAEIYRQSLNSLKIILDHFNIRWKSAGTLCYYIEMKLSVELTKWTGIYMDALEDLDMVYPITFHSMLGASVGTRGPLCEPS